MHLHESENCTSYHPLADVADHIGVTTSAYKSVSHMNGSNETTPYLRKSNLSLPSGGALSPDS